MELAELIYRMAQDSVDAGGLTDMTIGTVTSESPLEITTKVAMAPLREQSLILTEPVVEKKIPILNHKHYIQTLGHHHTCSQCGATTTDLTGAYLGETSLVSDGYDPTLQTQDIVCWEHEEELPIENGFIILNRKLEVGDKVLLLRVMHGQQFIVLSRIFEHK